MDADEIGPSYCRMACGESSCDDCPRPRLLPENAEAARLFRASETQWRISANGAITGLDYVALELLMKLHEVEDKKDAFWRVQVMEREILKILREVHDDDNED